MALSVRNPESGAHEPVRPPRRVDAYLVSADDAFLIEAGPAFSDRFRTRSIDDLADLPDPSENKNWLVVLDTASLSDARATVGALEQRIAGRPIIVVVPDGDTTDWRLVLSRGTVIDAVPRQDLLQPRFATALLNAEERVHAAPGPIPAGPRDTAPSLRPLISIALTPLVGGALAFVGLAAIVGVWLHLRSRITDGQSCHDSYGQRAVGHRTAVGRAGGVCESQDGAAARGRRYPRTERTGTLPPGPDPGSGE